MAHKWRKPLDGAYHGSEILGDTIQSIEILKNVTQATYEWLK